MGLVKMKHLLRFSCGNYINTPNFKFSFNSKMSIGLAKFWKDPYFYSYKLVGHELCGRAGCYFLPIIHPCIDQFVGVTTFVVVAVVIVVVYVINLVISVVVVVVVTINVVTTVGNCCLFLLLMFEVNGEWDTFRSLIDLKV